MSTKLKLSWEEVADLIEASSLDRPDQVVYGIPSGGMILSSMFKHARMTFNPKEATLFVDDIIDSGRTRSRYAENFPRVPFWAAVDKVGNPSKWRAFGWIEFPWETDHPGHGRSDASIEDNVVRILQYLHPQPDSDGIRDTPKRVVKSWNEIYGGYSVDLKSLFTVFEKGEYDQMIVLKDIEFFSMCEHHMLPFFGKAHVAYIPQKKVVGISKLARVVDAYARRLQIQERIGEQVTSLIMEELKPLGAACIIESSHLCMRMRGINKQNSSMTTMSLRGVFKDNPEVKNEFLAHLR